MNFLKNILKNQTPEAPKIDADRLAKDLLRENLSLVPIDIFYIDDPKIGVPPDKLTDYYKKFYDICIDKDVMDRIKFLMNKQALLTLENNKNGVSDIFGGLNINGMASVKDDFQRMGNSYLQSLPTSETVDKYRII